MDPPSDLPPPPAAQPPFDVPISVTGASTLAPTSIPMHPPLQTHPSYAEMITAAISALNERDGSSRRAIAKYIETHYSNLPPTHSALLTHYLKRLKVNSQLVMVKHSYKLPRSAPPPPGAVNGAVKAASSDPASAVPKRRPGRPPKPKPDAGQAAVPVFAPPVDMNAMPAVVPVANVATELINGPAPGLPVRGRGRPPKQGGSKRGRPRQSVRVVGVVGRGRGRPKKNAASAALVGREKGQGRPRGRPPKSVNLVQGLAPGVPVGRGVAAAPAAVSVTDVGAFSMVCSGIAQVAGKRRGRPPKAGSDAKKPRILTTEQPKKPRKLSGKPLGRPRKTSAQSQDSQLLVAYLDLKGKLETLQLRVKQTATLLKPYLNNEAAISAVQELELVAMSVGASSDSQWPHPHPQHQPQPLQQPAPAPPLPPQTHN